jgi:hypothetical protein
VRSFVHDSPLNAERIFTKFLILENFMNFAKND